MASGLFAILDDIAMLLDDAAAMTKVAAKKTAGVLGDDLAVNAEKASGFHESRELPVLWAISKGSLVNKIIILPFAFLLSAFLPWLIVPILLIGGVYLSYEGVEKIVEWFHPHENNTEKAQVLQASAETIVEVEKKKIKSAIVTDFILSVEIIIIALGSVMDKSFTLQLIVVSAVALIATVGVYGFVALIVRMDDAGFWLIQRAEANNGNAVLGIVGNGLVNAMPRLIQALSVIGTIAMLLVGGGMFVHNIAFIHHALEFLPSIIAEFLVGGIVGGIAVGVMMGIHSFMKK
ncbi:hypothetical protein BegalDRAFT_2814 [Beggiatoa alba B18LD]|uniref:DUF808 domain-containing protein n=1 Tax=Beggiatoa alba B18LD TaxID=395493 RepID=I3CJ56_9GAMM|nr:DUF808 domain-containing protein [Beggiatoa alba]EIJ43649.1 hypothetical protein BegalDRAFT_2814 [Beggiatoa alba B18LD]